MDGWIDGCRRVSVLKNDHSIFIVQFFRFLKNNPAFLFVFLFEFNTFEILSETSEIGLYISC